MRTHAAAETIVRGPDTDGSRRIRVGLWLALIAAWLVAAYYMWDALTAMASAERTQEPGLVPIASPRLFFASVVFSAMELAVVLAALWPWRREFYATRLAVAALALVTWFIMTTTMDLTRIDWVHRRWLGVMIGMIVVALAVLGVYRAARRRVPRRLADGG